MKYSHRQMWWLWCCGMWCQVTC